MNFKTGLSILILFSMSLTGCNYESQSSGVSIEESNTATSENTGKQNVNHGDIFETTTRASSGELVQITARNQHGRAMFEGDIMIGHTKDLVNQHQELKSRMAKGLRISKIPANMGRFWTNAVVPYQFADGYDESNQQSFIDATIQIADATPVTFIERTPSNRDQFPNYIEIVNSGDPAACWSYLGMIGGKQEMGLGSACRTGTIIHEIGHALGLWHEHTRADRDNFVTINWDNIIEDRKSQFKLNLLAETFGPYDYGSIMHYPTWGFSINRWENTITPSQEGVSIGQRSTMSAGDIAVITDTYADLVEELDFELENNIPVMGLSGTRGDERRMVLPLPEGTIKNLSFQLTGGSGDADLYVKQGSAPSLSDYDCRPYIGGNHENCSFNTPANGEYHIMIRAYSSYAGAQIVASYEIVNDNDEIISLQNGISSPSLQHLSNTVYKIEVPAGMSRLDVTTNIFGTSVADGIDTFQLRYADKPQHDVYDCAANTVKYMEATASGTCTVLFPQEGTWYMTYRPTSNLEYVSMLASYIKQDQSVLANNNVRSNLSTGSKGDVIRYIIQVPNGSSKLKITTTGSNGDADLYIKHGSQPGTSNYDCRSYSGSSNEQCSVSNPAGGIYHIMVRAYRPFSGLTLRATIN